MGNPTLDLCMVDYINAGSPTLLVLHDEDIISMYTAANMINNFLRKAGKIFTVSK